MFRIRYIMGRTIDTATQATLERLRTLGERIRGARKALGLTAQEVADAAGLSRVTLHRIEKGEPGVTMGAYANVMQMVGMPLNLPNIEHAEVEIPEVVRVSDFATLGKLAWQLKPGTELRPAEAWDIYDRNQRMIVDAELTDGERRLIELLRREFGRPRV